MNNGVEYSALYVMKFHIVFNQKGSYFIVIGATTTDESPLAFRMKSCNMEYFLIMHFSFSILLVDVIVL